MLKKVLIKRKNLIFHPVVLLILLSVFLRLLGIWHSFPFILHPDEPTIVRSALEIRFDPNPGHFDWPHLYIYINYFVYMIFAHFRDLLVSINLKGVLSPIFPLLWDDNLIFYLISRFLTSLIGALTIVPVFLTAKGIFNKSVGYLAAATLAITPYHIWHSQYSMGDVPMMFCIAWALYFASKILTNSDSKNYILSGLFIGLAASLKYNGGLTAIIVPLAHILRIHNFQKTRTYIDIKGLKSLCMSGLFAFLGFIFGTPYALFDYATFSRTDGPKGAFWQFTNVGKVSFHTQLSKFGNFFFTKLPDDFGYTPLIMYLIGLLFILLFLGSKSYHLSFIKKHLSHLVFLYLPSLFLFFYIAGFEKSRSHYYFVAYPYVVIISAFILENLRLCLRKNKPKLLFPVLLLYFIIPSLLVINNTYKRIFNERSGLTFSKVFTSYDE